MSMGSDDGPAMMGVVWMLLSCFGCIALGEIRDRTFVSNHRLWKARPDVSEVARALRAGRVDSGWNSPYVDRRDSKDRVVYVLDFEPCRMSAWKIHDTSAKRR